MDSLQDAPEGHVLLVQPAKDDASNICLKCFYVKRGSFNKLKIMDLLAVLFLVPTLQDKLLACVNNWSFA